MFPEHFGENPSPGLPPFFCSAVPFAAPFAGSLIENLELGRGVGGWLKNTSKTPALAGWPRRLALVRATLRAEFDVISAQLCSCARAFFP